MRNKNSRFWLVAIVVIALPLLAAGCAYYPAGPGYDYGTEYYGPYYVGPPVSLNLGFDYYHGYPGYYGGHRGYYGHHGGYGHHGYYGHGGHGGYYGHGGHGGGHHH